MSAARDLYAANLVTRLDELANECEHSKYHQECSFLRGLRDHIKAGLPSNYDLVEFVLDWDWMEFGE